MNDYKGTTGAKLLAAALSVLVLACALVAVGGVGESDAAATASIDGVSYCDADGTYILTVESSGLDFGDTIHLKNAMGQDVAESRLAGTGHTEIRVDTTKVGYGSYQIQAYRGTSLIAGTSYGFDLLSVVLVYLNGTPGTFMISSDDLPKNISDIPKISGSSWALSEGGAPVTEISASMFSDRVLVLYQTEGPAAYTVTFDSMGGTSVPSQTVVSGNTVARPADPVREGYTFTGWFVDAGCEVAYDFATPVTGNITLYAGWEEVVTYTVTFESNGGTSVPSQTVVSGGTASEPSEPTREGYWFTGWFVDAACTSLYSFGTPVTADITLYAGWSNSPVYTVTFESNGGTPVDSVRVVSGNTVPRPADPVREGYTFTGWFADPDCKDAYDFATPVTGNVTLYAGWSETPAPSGGSDDSLVWAGAAVAVVAILAALVAAFVLAKRRKA